MKKSFLQNKTILITGGTGSFGQKFTEICLKKYKPKKIIIYSRDELKQVEMEKKFPGNRKTQLRYFIGDVRDLMRLKLAMQGVDYVVHAAALKHVPIAEYNPFEVVKTNIMGGQNVIDASLEMKVKKVLALSTDKAAAPVNLYGASKLTSDKLFISANNFKGKNDIRFSIVRYGNVMGSRGSVIPLFLQQMKENCFLVTDKNMTRFNITLEHGVEYVIVSLSRMQGGELFVPKLPSYRITDLTKAIEPNIKTKIVGIRPGEKIHEELITESDSLNTLEFKNEYVILPNLNHSGVNTKKYLKKFFYSKGKLCKPGFKYTSKNNKNFLKISEIKNLIKKLEF